jgi:hypothetical protein
MSPLVVEKHESVQTTASHPGATTIAVVFRPAGRPEVRAFPRPPAPPGGAIIRVTLTTIRGTDVRTLEGERPVHLCATHVTACRRWRSPRDSCASSGPPRATA